ncbi:MAG: nicotinamide mononucleotide transporter [Clostridia bacterium]|nr:nicotinamide mononucleotide transporter [Clostridia bacterium]
MNKLKSAVTYFSKAELFLWLFSLSAILLSFFIFGQTDYLNLIASLIGVTSLIFCAKGNPVGQVLMIIFSLLYGYISYSVSYYGEMVTYLGMTLPMSVFSLVSWFKNPFVKGKSEVRVNKISKKEFPLSLILTSAVTLFFYFILKFLSTANIIPGTLSVATSFLAAYLTFRRSPYFALAYAVNDIVLIILWILASLRDTGYVSVIVCFVIFLINDLYGFYNWKKMEKKQHKEKNIQIR